MLRQRTLCILFNASFATSGDRNSKIKSVSKVIKLLNELDVTRIDVDVLLLELNNSEAPTNAQQSPNKGMSGASERVNEQATTGAHRQCTLLYQ